MTSTFRCIHDLSVCCSFWSLGPKCKMTTYMCWWINAFLVVSLPVCLLWFSRIYSKPSELGGSPPVSLCTSPLFFIYTFRPLHHKRVQRASGSSWVCGHNTETATSKLPPSSLQKKDDGRGRKEKREKSGTNSFSHTHHRSVSGHGKIATHICSAALRTHQSPYPLHSGRSVWLFELPRSTFCRVWGFGGAFLNFRLNFAPHSFVCGFFFCSLPITKHSLWKRRIKSAFKASPVFRLGHVHTQRSNVEGWDFLAISPIAHSRHNTMWGYLQQSDAQRAIFNLHRHVWTTEAGCNELSVSCTLSQLCSF